MGAMEQSINLLLMVDRVVFFKNFALQSYSKREHSETDWLGRSVA